MYLLAISAASTLSLLVISVTESGGIPASLSSTYYDLNEDGWIFQVLLSISSISLFPVWVEECTGNNEWMSFVACLSLLFVAAAPSFRMVLEGSVHYTSAAICCFCTALWQIYEGYINTLLPIGCVFATLAAIWRDRWCWWLECAIVGSLYASVMHSILTEM